MIGSLVVPDPKYQILIAMSRGDYMGNSDSNMWQNIWNIHLLLYYLKYNFIIV